MKNDDVLRLVLAALFSAAASFLATSIKAQRDEQRDLCDEFSAMLLRIADVGSEYWLLAADDAEVPLLQVRMLGGQAYLARYRILALGWFSPLDRYEVEERLADFYGELTGGGFKGKGRPADPNRAEQCQVLAANLAVVVKAANTKSLTLRAQIVRLVRWHSVATFIGDQFRWTRIE